MRHCWLAFIIAAIAMSMNVIGVHAQIGPIDPNADNPNPCSCAPQYYAACCGTGQAQLKVRYCQNQNPSECTCNYNCRVENAGACGPTSASACQGTSSPPPSSDGNEGGGDSNGWGSCGSCNCGHGNECRSTPDGACVWDPGGCGPNSGGGGGGADSGHGPETQTQCNACGGRLCGQSGCTSRHDKAPAAPYWVTGNQSSVVMSAGNTRVALEWRDPAPRDSCQAEKENHYDILIQRITGFEGNVLETAVNTRMARGGLHIPDGNDERDQLMRYNFTPSARYYRASIRAVNTICSSSNPKVSGWVAIEFQVMAQQTGKIFLDVNNDAVVDANGRCVSPSLNEADANTHIIAQRNTAPWNTYQSLDAWGWVFRTSWPQVSLASLGTPFAPNAYSGSPASIVDGSMSSGWVSNARGEDTNHRKVGINFTTPQTEIQVISLHELSYDNVKAAPHSGVNMDGIGVMGVPGYHKYWTITPGIPLSYIRFTSNGTGFAERERWGVAEIRAWRNPNPSPEIFTVSDQLFVAQSGWTNQGGFSLNSAFGASSTLNMILNTDDFTCSCPEGCQYNISGANQNMHFFLNFKAAPWFQVHNGGVAAFGNSGLAISNPIPEQCTPARGCTPVMIRTPNSTAPVVMTGGGTLDMSDLPGSQTTGIDDENRNWLARLSATPARQDFTYLRRIYKFPTTAVDDFPLNFNHVTKPSAAPRNVGLQAYYQAGDLTITSSWAVDSGESYVILVDGMIHVNAEIAVVEGGFLALVSSEDIVFAPTLGSSDIHSTTPVVEGVYIADGKIRLPQSQLKFVGAGTFVGWGGFDLLRDYASTDNWSEPTELFIYRPDFLLNAPEEMKTPRYDWNEINP